MIRSYVPGIMVSLMYSFKGKLIKFWFATFEKFRFKKFQYWIQHKILTLKWFIVCKWCLLIKVYMNQQEFDLAWQHMNLVPKNLKHLSPHKSLFALMD